jgi:hypothetical protein
VKHRALRNPHEVVLGGGKANFDFLGHGAKVLGAE